jgi:putative transposase
VGDITFVRAGGRFAYVRAVLDLFSRKLIACLANERASPRPVLNVFAASVTRRTASGKSLFRENPAGFSRERSPRGAPAARRAVAESFFKFLKMEELNRKSFKILEELRLSLFEYARFYNDRRPHSANGGLTPNQKEAIL